MEGGTEGWNGEERGKTWMGWEKNPFEKLPQLNFLIDYVPKKKEFIENLANIWQSKDLFSGKPELCKVLMDGGAYAQKTNTINKSASEMAAFVGTVDYRLVNLFMMLKRMVQASTSVSQSSTTTSVSMRYSLVYPSIAMLSYSN